MELLVTPGHVHKQAYTSLKESPEVSASFCLDVIWRFSLTQSSSSIHEAITSQSNVKITTIIDLGVVTPSIIKFVGFVFVSFGMTLVLSSFYRLGITGLSCFCWTLPKTNATDELSQIREWIGGCGGRGRRGRVSVFLPLSGFCFAQNLREKISDSVRLPPAAVRRFSR